jgi:hypothetical protein
MLLQHVCGKLLAMAMPFSRRALDFEDLATSLIRLVRSFYCYAVPEALGLHGYWVG